MKKHQLVLTSLLAFLFLPTSAFAVANQNPDAQAAAVIDLLNKQAANQENDSSTQIMNQAASNIAIKPDDYRSHFILGKGYENLGMEELSAEEYKKAESAGEPFKKFVLSCLKAKVMASEFTEALSYYPFAARFYPRDSAVVLTHAVQLHSRGQLEEEEKLLLELKSNGTQELGIMSALAAIKLEKNNYEEALELFNRDLAINAQYKPAVLGKALALSKLGQYGSSLALALPLYREGDWTNYRLAALVTHNFAQLGSLNTRPREIRQKFYEQAFQSALVSLAVARRQSEMDSAKHRAIFVWKHLSPVQRSAGLTEVSAVLDKLTFGPRMHFALGDALKQAEYPHDAEFQFRTGLKLDGRHARAYLHIAEIYEHYYHKKASAILNYLKYLHYAGGDPAIEAHLRRLSEESSRVRDIALRLKSKLYSRKSK